MTASKWDGLPLYDRPLGKAAEGIDDGRPVVTISNFSVCQPSESITESSESGCWQLVDFATDEFEGKMLHATKDNPPPDITIPLNVEGWYAVYVWLMGSGTSLSEGELNYYCRYSQSNGPLLKLSNDKYFSGIFKTITHENMAQPGLEGCFWRYADLTDESIVVRHQGHTVHLGAIRLIPLSPAEVAEVKKQRKDTSNKKLILKTDSHAKSWVEAHTEFIRNSDVFAWMSGCQERHGLMNPNGAPGLLRWKQACEELGLEWYVCDRPSRWTPAFIYNSDVLQTDPRFNFFSSHLEYRCQERDGTPSNALSYAVPEVRGFMLDRVRAVAKLGPDGFGYFFNRDPGMVLFEPAAVEGFREKYGVDARELHDLDDRLLDWRAGIITSYMHEVRDALDEVSKEKGLKRIKGVQLVLGSEAANRRWSYDVKRWIDDGLIDMLVIMPWADYPEWRLAQGIVKPDIKYFKSLVKGKDIPVISMWFSWEPEVIRANEYFARAMEEYAEGADGLSFWDQRMFRKAFSANRWVRLGHKEQLSEWVAEDFPLPPYMRLTRHAGKTTGRFQWGAGN